MLEADCESVGWPPVLSQTPSTHNFGPFKDHHILQKDITLTAFHSRIVPWNIWNIVSTSGNISCRTFSGLAMASNLSYGPTDLLCCMFTNLYHTCSLNDNICSLDEPVLHWYVHTHLMTSQLQTSLHWYVHTFWWRTSTTLVCRHILMTNQYRTSNCCHDPSQVKWPYDVMTQHHNAWCDVMTHDATPPPPNRWWKPPTILLRFTYQFWTFICHDPCSMWALSGVTLWPPV